MGENDNLRIKSSFRDPSGHLFFKNGELYRQINLAYKANYDYLIDSGLYDALVARALIIPHIPADIDTEKERGVYKIIKPEVVPFISYPFEWCFGQLKQAALTTLEIQRIALDFGMTLKDSSAYNIQFRNGGPVLIDTLSFEKYQEGKYWFAYKQFCQHFLASLALMSYRDVRLNQLSRIYLDGIPLDMASSLLPLRSRLQFSLLAHIHWHSSIQQRYANNPSKVRHGRLTRLSFFAFIDNLEKTVKNLKWRPCHNNGWQHYYAHTDYSSEAMGFKKKVVADFLDRIHPKFIFDCGANIGLFSRLASSKNAQVVSLDSDYSAVEENYFTCTKEGERNILPLVVDLANPSAGIGWESEERVPFFERGPVDTALALALIHHLVISNNIPLRKLANFFIKICNFLIIEFIPKTDAQVQRLLANREDIFQDYTEQNFEKVFQEYFSIENAVKIKDSQRTLYLLKNKLYKTERIR